jgi:hypothetical protein
MIVSLGARHLTAPRTIFRGRFHTNNAAHAPRSLGYRALPCGIEIPGPPQNRAPLRDIDAPHREAAPTVAILHAHARQQC